MIICHIITGLNNGGAESSLFRLCTAHWPENYRHIVITLGGDNDYYIGRLESAGIQVHSLNMPRGKMTFGGLVKLYRLLKSIKPDLVQTWLYHADFVGGVVSRLCGIRSLAWGIRNGNLDADKNRTSTLFVVRLCAKLSYWLPARIVSCSHFATKSHLHAGYCASKFVNIANGYPLDRFVPNRKTGFAFRNSLSLHEKIPVLGMVGRFDPQKDHNNLLQALALLKQQGIEFVCLFVGSQMTSDNTLLMSVIAKANIMNEVRLLGLCDEIPIIMNALDIHVLSSAGEAFPNVLSEAMACGTPCVTTDVGDAALIVGDTGWVVAPCNSQALADAIACALIERQDSVAWQRRQTACRAHIIDNFSLEKMVSAYKQVWEDVVDIQKNKKSI